MQYPGTLDNMDISLVSESLTDTFPSQYSFPCWEQEILQNINSIFDQEVKLISALREVEDLGTPVRQAEDIERIAEGSGLGKLLQKEIEACDTKDLNSDASSTWFPYDE
ncbi:2942_t:CDS:2 [Acaulospora colombiana]|uniref:2942_t:CDS:1 n=1 Tax=Acaulospora colombiana TaxID=27376 RepID=A0ACA9NLI0_9GLOM|nr:2942_t:CDS:2 [Acaulospora colombiana]